MGKGTNYVKKPTLLDGLVLAGKLLKHTRDIIKNEKVFDPKRDFQNRLLIKIYETALDVNAKAYVANELRVGENPRIASERLALQAFAIASCEALLGLLADAKVGLALHPIKSRVVEAKDGALFLGFIYRITARGRVLMLRDPQRVKETRRKYRRLVNRMKRGEIAPEKLDASYQGVRACMEKGTNRRLVRRMDDFVNSLKGELENAA